MYRIMNAHPLTVIVVMAAMMVAPMYALWAYVASNASARKGARIGAAFLVWGAVMSWVCLARVPLSVGPLGRLIIPVCWAGPTVVLLMYRGWFLDRPLAQHWLIGLQVWRVVGGVFLVEMARGNLPGIFAYPAGVGDLIVAALACGVLVRYRKRVIPRVAVLSVIGLGMADLGSAFFFGFTSSAGPQQLFFPAVVNDSLLYPTGLIPLFLVPCSIFFHALSWLELGRERGAKKREFGETSAPLGVAGGGWAT
jgi:hypothetical protein